MLGVDAGRLDGSVHSDLQGQLQKMHSEKQLLLDELLRMRLNQKKEESERRPQVRRAVACCVFHYSFLRRRALDKARAFYRWSKAVALLRSASGPGRLERADGEASAPLGARALQPWGERELRQWEALLDAQHRALTQDRAPSLGSLAPLPAPSTPSALELGRSETLSRTSAASAAVAMASAHSGASSSASAARRRGGRSPRGYGTPTSRLHQPTILSSQRRAPALRTPKSGKTKPPWGSGGGHTRRKGKESTADRRKTGAAPRRQPGGAAQQAAERSLGAAGLFSLEKLYMETTPRPRRAAAADVSPILLGGAGRTAPRARGGARGARSAPPADVSAHPAETAGDSEPQRPRSVAKEGNPQGVIARWAAERGDMDRPQLRGAARTSPRSGRGLQPRRGPPAGVDLEC